MVWVHSGNSENTEELNLGLLNLWDGRGNMEKSPYDKFLYILIALLAIFYPILLIKFPVVSDTTVPTLVNGITTSLSIIFAFGAGIVGFVFRHDIERGDSEARNTYLIILMIFFVLLVYPWGAYCFLAQGIDRSIYGVNAYNFALRYALCGYFVGMFALAEVYLLTARKWYREEKKQLDKNEPEEGPAKPDENKTKEKSKNVNVFVSVSNQ
jgi:hypothetical protein